MLIRHALGLGVALTGPPQAPPTAPADHAARIQVWTDNGTDPYQSGERVHVFIRGEEDSYVTVFRVDTDGRVRVLFPRDPWMDNYVRGGRDYEVEQARSANAFDIDDDPGVGYLFAVSSPDPFKFDPLVDGDHWDYRAVSDGRDGRIHGDPYVALTDLAARILPAGASDWDYDVSPYYVERHFDYPRFLCYDCHAYASFGAWDPYAATCPRFRIVAYDDPAYYPYRYYQGRSVVFTRPLRPEPRFVFKDRAGVGDDQFVTVARTREGESRGATGRDFGGAGRVPAPARGQAPAGQHPEPRRRPAAEPPPRRQPAPHQPPPKPGVEPRHQPPRSPPKAPPPKGQPELRRRKP